MKESRESLAEMQKSHKKAAADQAKAAADLSLKAIQAVSASNAKITRFYSQIKDLSPRLLQTYPRLTPGELRWSCVQKHEKHDHGKSRCID